MLAVGMMMLSRVSRLREHHDGRHSDRYGHQLHKITPIISCARCLLFHQQTKASPTMSKARPSKRKRLAKERGAAV
jgi:hypothetical protein